MITLRLLGGAFVEIDGQALTGAVTRRHALACLALLARAPSRQLSREKLVGHLWPDRPPRDARHRLRDIVYAIRGSLGANALLTVGDDLRLDVTGLEIDVLDFQDALQRGALSDAVAQYAGPFLDGFYLRGNAGFERWVESERLELARAHRSALRALARAAEEDGRPRDAARWWQQLTRLEPYEADVALGLAGALAAGGDPAGALRAAESHAARLAEDLGAEPSPELQALAGQLRTGPAARLDHHPLRSAPTADRPPPEARAELPARAPPSKPGARACRSFAFGVLSLVAVLGFASILTKPERPVTDARRVAVFPFAVHGEGVYQYLGRGLVDLLSIKLAVPGETRAVAPTVIVSRTSGERPPLDVAALGRLAGSLGAGAFVQGSIVQSDGTAQILASLYAVGVSTPRAVASVEVHDEAGLFTAVDRLCRDLLSGWLAQEGESYSRLAGLTTESLPAFKAYLAGERALQEGRYRQSVARFTEATDRDPEFALAHYRTSVAANWAGLPDLVRSSTAEAWRRREGLPEQARRLLDARFLGYFRHRGIEESVHLLRGIIDDYPDDVEARYQLADLRFHHGWLWGLGDSAVRTDFERVLAYDPGHSEALIHLVRLVARLRDFRALDTLVEHGLSVVVDGKSRRELEALAAFTRHDPAARRRVLEHLRDLDDESLLSVAGVTAVFSENLADATRLAGLLQQPDRDREVRAFGLVWGAALEAARGRLDTARARLRTEELDPRLSAVVGLLIEVTAPDPGTLDALRRARNRLAAVSTTGVGDADPPELLRGYVSRAYILALLGLGSARLGDTAKAREYADQLERLVAPAPEARGAATIRAATALWGGNPGGAMRLLDEARVSRPAVPADWQTFLRAEVLREMGADEAALRWYAALPSDYFFAPLFTATSHRRRAELYRRLGRRSESEEHLRRVADLWVDADPSYRTLVREALTLEK